MSLKHSIYIFIEGKNERVLSFCFFKLAKTIDSRLSYSVIIDIHEGWVYKVLRRVFKTIDFYEKKRVLIFCFFKLAKTIDCLSYSAIIDIHERWVYKVLLNVFKIFYFHTNYQSKG